MRSFLTALLVSALIAAGAWAQSVATSQISGTVRDSTGLVLPEAQVQVTQTDTGLVRSARTNSEGVYVLPSLPIGPYKMEVKKEGFSTFIQSGIVLQVDSNPTLDVSLKVGSVSEQIQVEASATMVETHTSGVGQVVDQERVVDLPLNGRYATDLIYLAGAADIAPNADLVSAKNYPNEAVPSVAGGQAIGTTYLLDGGTHNDPFNNLNLPLPFPDALQEFKVETSALPAQYGQHSGGAVNAVTKIRRQPVSRRCFRVCAQLYVQFPESWRACAGFAKAQPVWRNPRWAHQEGQAVFLPGIPGQHHTLQPDFSRSPTFPLPK